MILFFWNSPIGTLNGEGEKGMNLKELFSVRSFFVFPIMMVVCLLLMKRKKKAI